MLIEEDGTWCHLGHFAFGVGSEPSNTRPSLGRSLRDAVCYTSFRTILRSTQCSMGHVFGRRESYKRLTRSRYERQRTVSAKTVGQSCNCDFRESDRYLQREPITPVVDGDQRLKCLVTTRSFVGPAYYLCSGSRESFPRQIDNSRSLFKYGPSHSATSSCTLMMP